MTIFPASLTTLICKTPFAMTSYNGRLAPKHKDAAICNDVSRPTGCVSIRSFSSLTFPAHLAATVTAIMVSLHFWLPSRYFFAFSSVFYSYYSMCFCSLLYDALWLGRDTLWPENSQKAATPLPASCATQTLRPEVATRSETTCMVAIR